MPPLIIGALIVAGGAVAGAAVAGRGARKAAETQAESQEQALQQQKEAARKEAETRGEAVDIQKVAAGERKAALEGIKLPTLLETPSGQELKGTLQERIAGRGISRIDVGEGTSAFAAQRRADLKREKAAIGASASARGLGRSTIPIGLEAQAGQAASRDIFSTTAELQRQNKILEAKQIVDSLNKFQSLTNQELNSQQKAQLFEAEKVLAEESGQINMANTLAGNASIERQNAFAISQSIARNGASAAANELQQAAILGSGIAEAAAGFGSALSAVGQSNDDIISAIQTSKEERDIGGIVLRGQNRADFEERRLSLSGR